MRSRRNLCLQLSLLRTVTIAGLSDFWLLQWFIGLVLQRVALSSVVTENFLGMIRKNGEPLYDKGP